MVWVLESVSKLVVMTFSWFRRRPGRGAVTGRSADHAPLAHF
jgi:hypothetical protein